MWGKPTSGYLVKLELKDSERIQKWRSTVKKLDDKFSTVLEETTTMDVFGGVPPSSKVPGELRIHICKVKKGLMSNGYTTVANAGVFVENIVKYILQEKKDIEKEFFLFLKDGATAGGKARLELKYRHTSKDPVVAGTPVSGIVARPVSEDEAATKIQSVFRGGKVRSTLAKKPRKGSFFAYFKVSFVLAAVA